MCFMRRLLCLVSAASHDLQRLIRQAALSDFATSQDARIQTSRSSSVVKITPRHRLRVDRLDDRVRRRRREAAAAEVRAGAFCYHSGSARLVSQQRRPNLWAGMPSSVIALIGSGCRIVGPEVLAAVAPARFVRNARWFMRSNCRFAVLRGHVRLHCGLGGLHEGVAVCPGGQGDIGPLFHSGRFLFHGPSHLRQFGCQRNGLLALLLQLSGFASPTSLRRFR